VVAGLKILGSKDGVANPRPAEIANADQQKKDDQEFLNLNDEKDF